MALLAAGRDLKHVGRVVCGRCGLALCVQRTGQYAAYGRRVVLPLLGQPPLVYARTCPYDLRCLLMLVVHNTTDAVMVWYCSLGL